MRKLIEKRRKSRKLQFEGAEGNVLGGNMQRTCVCKLGRAARQRLFGCDLREVGRIILLRKMREHEVFCAAVEYLGIAEELADDRI